MMFSIMGKLLIFEIYLFLSIPSWRQVALFLDIPTSLQCMLIILVPSFVVESPMGVAVMQVKASRYGFIGLNFHFAS